MLCGIFIMAMAVAGTFIHYDLKTKDVQHIIG